MIMDDNFDVDEPKMDLQSESSYVQGRHFHKNHELAKIFVAKIPYFITEDEIKAVFEYYGPIAETKMLYHDDGAFRGCAFIKFVSTESAIKALGLDGLSVFCQEHLVVREAEDKRTYQKKKEENWFSFLANPPAYRKLSVRKRRAAYDGQRDDSFFAPQTNEMGGAPNSDTNHPSGATGYPPTKYAYNGYLETPHPQFPRSRYTPADDRHDDGTTSTSIHGSPAATSGAHSGAHLPYHARTIRGAPTMSNHPPHSMLLSPHSSHNGVSGLDHGHTHNGDAPHVMDKMEYEVNGGHHNGDRDHRGLDHDERPHDGHAQRGHYGAGGDTQQGVVLDEFGYMGRHHHNNPHPNIAPQSGYAPAPPPVRSQFGDHHSMRNDEEASLALSPLRAASRLGGARGVIDRNGARGGGGGGYAEQNGGARDHFRDASQGRDYHNRTMHKGEQQLPPLGAIGTDMYAHTEGEEWANGHSNPRGASIATMTNTWGNVKESGSRGGPPQLSPGGVGVSVSHDDGDYIHPEYAKGCMGYELSDQIRDNGSGTHGTYEDRLSTHGTPQVLGTRFRDHGSFTTTNIHQQFENNHDHNNNMRSNRESGEYQHRQLRNAQGQYPSVAPPSVIIADFRDSDSNKGNVRSMEQHQLAHRQSILPQDQLPRMNSPNHGLFENDIFPNRDDFAYRNGHRESGDALPLPQNPHPHNSGLPRVPHQEYHPQYDNRVGGNVVSKSNGGRIGGVDVGSTPMLHDARGSNGEYAQQQQQQQYRGNHQPLPHSHPHQAKDFRDQRVDNDLPAIYENKINSMHPFMSDIAQQQQQRENNGLTADSHPQQQHQESRSQGFFQDLFVKGGQQQQQQQQHSRYGPPSSYPPGLSQGRDENGCPRPPRYEDAQQQQQQPQQQQPQQQQPPKHYPRATDFLNPDGDKSYGHGISDARVVLSSTPVVSHFLNPHSSSNINEHHSRIPEHHQHSLTPRSQHSPTQSLRSSASKTYSCNGNEGHRHDGPPPPQAASTALPHHHLPHPDGIVHEGMSNTHAVVTHANGNGNGNGNGGEPPFLRVPDEQQYSTTPGNFPREPHYGNREHGNWEHGDVIITPRNSAGQDSIDAHKTTTATTTIGDSGTTTSFEEFGLSRSMSEHDGGENQDQDQDQYQDQRSGAPLSHSNYAQMPHHHHDSGSGEESSPRSSSCVHQMAHVDTILRNSTHMESTTSVHSSTPSLALHCCGDERSCGSGSANDVGRGGTAGSPQSISKGRQTINLESKEACLTEDNDDNHLVADNMPSNEGIETSIDIGRSPGEELGLWRDEELDDFDDVLNDEDVNAHLVALSENGYTSDAIYPYFRAEQEFGRKGRPVP